MITLFYFFKLAFDFCRFCMLIGFFIPATTANDPDFEGFLYQIYIFVLS